jgi:ubiquinone/menaquinone biosynthesis C-methylase UbiE
VLAEWVGEVVLADLSSRMLDQASEKHRLRPVRAQAERLPFADGSFARILVVDAFHHFHRQEEAAGELVRVLAPAGRLVVEEPNVEHWSVKLLALGERLLLMRSHFYHPEAIRRLFETHNSQATLHTDGSFNAWVVVEKEA